MLTATNNVLIDTNQDDWIRTSGPFVPNEVQKTLELFECRVIAIIKKLILPNSYQIKFLKHLDDWLIKMKSFSVVASIFPVIACGFIAALLDLGDRVTYEILDIFYTIASTPGAQRELVYASRFRREAQLKSLQPQTFEMPVEDPWLTVIAPCNTPCCYLSITSTQKPLFYPGSGVPNQPDPQCPAPTTQVMQ